MNHVHLYDLAKGHVSSWTMPMTVTGLSLTDDGVRVFVVCTHSVMELETQSGQVTTLFEPVDEHAERPPGALGFATGAAIERASGALVVCDQSGQCVVRVTGIRL